MNDYKALDLALLTSKDWLHGVNERPVSATRGLTSLRKSLDKPLNSEGLPAQQVIEDLVTDTNGGLLGSTGGRFFAWVIGGGLPSALAADWLVSAWDQNAKIYKCSPSASIIEEVTGKWIKDLLDLPMESSFAFTTGTQLAHFTCLNAARSTVLKQVGWDCMEDGLYGAPPIQIFTNENRHVTVDRAIRYLGLGTKCIKTIPTDERGRAKPQAFQEQLSRTKGPTIVILDAADLNIAAFDPFEELIPLAKEVRAWVHIDGAFGLFARASDKYRPLTKGIELADSWATDGHKWLNTPFDCGIAIIRDEEAHRESMSIGASYIAREPGARDQVDWNPEFSRRARGIPIYAALRELGKQGVADLIERSCRYCHTIVTQVGALPEVELLWKPQLNQGLLRFLDPKPGATEKDHDIRTQNIINAINTSGKAFFQPTIWKGQVAMRVSVVNWRTTDKDVEITIEAIKNVLELQSDEDAHSHKTPDFLPTDDYGFTGPLNV